MTVRYDVAINADGWQSEHSLRMLVDRVLEATLHVLEFDDVDSELSLVFTDDANIRTINSKWRHIDKATNVLSFPAFPIQSGQRPGPILGDIVIARETVQQDRKSVV